MGALLFLLVICGVGVCVCVSVHSIIILFNVNVVQMRFRLNFSSFLDIVAAAAVGALFLFVFPILFFYMLLFLFFLFSFSLSLISIRRHGSTFGLHWLYGVLRHIMNNSTRPYNPVAFLPCSHVIVGGSGGVGGAFFRTYSIDFVSLPSHRASRLCCVYSLYFSVFIHD